PPAERPLRLTPADRRGDLLDVADEIGVERLSARPYLLARRQEVHAANLERVEPRAASNLVDLRLADPLQVRRAEGAVRTGRRSVRVDARGVDAVGGPAVGARRCVACATGDAGPVVRVRAGVEQALDLACQQAPV